MKRHRLIGLVAVVVGQLLGGVAPADCAETRPENAGSALKVSPVLRTWEPPDSGQVTLPGPPAVTPAIKTIKHITPIPPVAKLAPSPRKLVEDAVLRAPLPRPGVAALPMKPAARQEIGREVAVYFQKQIGRWRETDAGKLLGEPKRQRPAYDDLKAVNGSIYAFNDPTGKYRELELDFDLHSGTLRTVFVYPPLLSWEDCRRQWSGPVSATDAAQGRKFYSYTNRRLDVLVDPAGNVISLGWY